MIMPSRLGIDWMQENFECCGINGKIDWANTAHTKATYWVKTHQNDVPDSCCTTVTDGCGTGKAVAAVSSDIHEKVWASRVLLFLTASNKCLQLKFTS